MRGPAPDRSPGPHSARTGYGALVHSAQVARHADAPSEGASARMAVRPELIHTRVEQATAST
jgi:hypothetical protein